MTDAPAPNPGPTGDFSLKLMLPALVFDVAVPIAVFFLFSSLGFSTLWALVASGLSPALNNLRLWIKQRRLEPLGIIVMALLAVGAAASLISGDLFFALVNKSLLTGAFGLICLGSLLGERPLLFYIIRQFVAGDDPQRLLWWNGLWQHAEFRAAQRLVTAVWGVTFLLEAAFRIGLAFAFPPEQIVVISPTIAFGVLVALILWTRRYLLALRARRLAQQRGQTA